MDELKPEQAASASAEVVADGREAVIRLVGELDITSVDAVRAEINTVLAASPERLIFDLSALEFMDSSGIAMLLIVAGAVGRIELRHASPIVCQVIEHTGLAGTLRLT